MESAELIKRASQKGKKLDSEPLLFCRSLLKVLKRCMGSDIFRFRPHTVKHHILMVGFRSFLNPALYLRHIQNTFVMLNQERIFTELLWYNWLALGKRVTHIKECHISIRHLGGKRKRN